MKLSILICTIPERSHLFTKLLDYLADQNVAEGLQCEILFDGREKGAISVGAKRQGLLEHAQGQYVCFIDDDDWVSPSYIKRILQAVQSSPDCIGFKIHCIFDNKKAAMASASLAYQDWAENVNGFKYVRSPYHKTPIRRDIALKVGFKDLRYAEDYDFSRRVRPLLKTEEYINEVMYYYRYTTENFNQKYGIK